ncbi:unnamed protein product [Cylindrotheca closterium]|uniref:Calmodulin n=1 Tax=Cylindrotheca closterium TaxID=2856 RepID=A0AAD2CK32_9STRA|nr:unnamed protein product [Cylindrotheca closterium]
MMKLLLALLLTTFVKGFVPSLSSTQRQGGSQLYSTAEEVSIEPKDVVRLFGRLAEKYIMLDESGGMCCYSGCKDCEYRLPDGGYRMADQSAARPKWIPVYEERNFSGQNKEHKTKWSTEIFSEGPSVTKEEFVKALSEMQYAPPLGGPFVGATAGQIEDSAAAEKLFDMLAGEKDKLARFKMSVQLKELAKGEQGLTWKDFAAAMGVQ